MDVLEAAAAQAGEAVRDLKTSGADKAAVDAAVAQLQAAKGALTAAVEAALAAVEEGSPEYEALQAKLPAAAKPKGKDKKKDAEGGGAPKNDRGAEKAARTAQRAEAAEKKAQSKDETVLGPALTLLDLDSSPFGNVFIQSHTASSREWTSVDALDPSLAGKKVRILGLTSLHRVTPSCPARCRVNPWCQIIERLDVSPVGLDPRAHGVVAQAGQGARLLPAPPVDAHGAGSGLREGGIDGGLRLVHPEGVGRRPLWRGQRYIYTHTYI